MLDLTKPVQARDGRPVRIIADDVKCDHPIVAVFTNADGNEATMSIRRDGRFHDFCETVWDLVNAPLGGVKWINVWSIGSPKNASSYGSRAEADMAAAIVEGRNRGQRRLACVSVAWKEGEGLDG